MAGVGRDAEELRERGETDPAAAPLEQAAGERGRAERRLGQPPAVDAEQLPLQEALIEACVVRDEERVAREGEEAAKNAGERRCAAQLLVA